ncbi:MAG: LysE family transporter, partial [Alphaproteobacteria bacterium]|nr:LysE family transporter [Alphaproteobacteria bacterium]
MTDFIFINGLLFGLVLAAPVGPVGVLCVQRTLSEGRLHGLLSGLGAAFGDAIYGAIAAFGISAIQLWIADHQAGLRTIGGIILLILAAKTLFVRSRRTTQTKVGKVHTESLPQDFISTFLLAITNPITMLVFAGLFATLGVTDAGDSVDNAALLVTGVFLGSALWWFALAFTANLARPYLDGGYQTWVSRISAAILIGFAGYALITAQFY